MFGCEVLRFVDVRALARGKPSRINFLDLELPLLELRSGVLKAPATHVGTALGRACSQSLSDLVLCHTQQGFLQFVILELQLYQHCLQPMFFVPMLLEVHMD